MGNTTRRASSAGGNTNPLSELELNEKFLHHLFLNKFCRHTSVSPRSNAAWKSCRVKSQVHFFRKEKVFDLWNARERTLISRFYFVGTGNYESAFPWNGGVTSKFFKNLFSVFNTRDYPHSRNGKYGRRAGCYVFFHFPFLGKGKLQRVTYLLFFFFRSWLLQRGGGAGFYRTPEAKEERRKKGNMERKKDKTKQLFFRGTFLHFHFSS